MTGNDGSYTFLKTVSSPKNNNKNNNKMRSDMRSVPDLKINRIFDWFDFDRDSESLLFS